jgi:predicted O-linked N-acetylglucosamine transferase (SPINDLY family)
MRKVCNWRSRCIEAAKFAEAAKLYRKVIKKNPREANALHRLADLFLTTLRYNAHTTASDALWTGLPVLT